MAKYGALKTEVINYGNNSFLEVALKKVIGEEGNEAKFISISKGWYPAEAEDPNTRRFKSAVGFPADKELYDKFVGALKSLESDIEAAAAAEPATA